MDRNQRQSRAEKRILGRNAVCPGGNAQPREDIGENCMEKERDKSCRELEITVEDTRGQVCPAKIRWVQEETQIQ